MTVRISLNPRGWLVIPLLLGILTGSGHTGATAQSDPESSASDRPLVVVGAIEGPIGPVTVGYVNRVLASAVPLNPQCVIFTLDTPGGLDASMRSIIKDILASPTPVVIFVYPGGARAASAGAIISLAAHVVAMAPGTNIGAAHPVAIGQGKMDEEMAAKVTNDAAAFSRGLALQRGRDEEWAEKIVRESISSTAEEALELGVADIVVDRMNELLEKLDGRVLTVSGRTITLDTSDAEVTEQRFSLRERILARITDPNIAYLLMLLGIFGIFFELQNPGAIFPGVVGGIAILVAFYALQLLPVNYAGVALILLAVILFLLEIKIPSGGVLTVGGVVAMLIGSIMFIDSPLPFMRVSFSVIIPAVIFTALFFMFAVGMGLRAQRRKVATGRSGMAGETGTARSDIGASGSVFVHGEHWNAFSDEPIAEGSTVEVVSVHGLKIKVRQVSK